MPAASWPAKIPASRPCASQAKKNMSKRTQRGTPRLSRPLGRMAARTVRRSLYPCASGHTSPSRGLQPVNPKNLRLRHPTETQEKPKKTQEKPATPAEQPLPAADVFLLIHLGETAVSDASGHTGLSPFTPHRRVPRIFSHVLSTGHHKPAPRSPAGGTHRAPSRSGHG
jgi:hypothetical protein